MASAQPISQPSHKGAPPMSNVQQAVSPPSKEQLKSWWTKFGRKKGKPDDQVPLNPGIFGVPLSESILYANVAISLTNEQGESFIYGYVPIVVAKCGVFLKEKATDVEGIFRLSGSAKRIKDLQTIFNSPERYGKGLDWTGYTVHDAANILRRYLNQLPEPIVPLQYYEQFRDPLRAYQAKVGSTAQAQAMENQEHTRAVVAYQKLITELPALNRQLLLYILDLLAVFASKSDLNRMTAQNLAAIFQPGIISHPNHDMAPSEYRLSQDVLIFLIENQDNFLIGMTGTAMDQKTKDEVKSGPPSIKTPKTAIGRSASTASAGADSIRRTAPLRRNGSISSRNSRDRVSPGVSNPATPVSPSGLAAAPGSAGGLGRSNTVPSNRSPGIAGARFQRMSEAPTSNAPIGNLPISDVGMNTNAPSITPDEELSPFPLAPGGGPGNSDSPVSEHPKQSITSNPAALVQGTDARMPSNHAEVAGQAGSDAAVSTVAPDARPVQDAIPTAPTAGKTNNRDRKISNLLAISPIFGPSDQLRDPNQRQPRKLQKRRIPGSHNESAQSSQASLNAEEAGASYGPASMSNNTTQELPNPTESYASPNQNAVVTPTSEQILAGPSTASPVAREGAGQSRGLMPPHSPTPSIHSRGSATDPSDLDMLEDPALREEKKRHRFRLSSARNDAPLVPPPTIGQLPGARTSNSSLGSNRPRKSFTGDSQLTQTSMADASSTGQPSFTNISSRESAEMLKDNQGEPEKKGLFGRFKAKMSQSRDHYEAERERAKSPPRVQGEHASSRGSLSAFAHDHFATRGRSVDRPREDSLPLGQQRPQMQNNDVRPGPVQPPVQTYVQPPTPVPGSNPASNPPYATASVPVSTSLPQEPSALGTMLPSSETAATVPAGVSPAPAPILSSNPSLQDTVSNQRVEADPISPTRRSHEASQTAIVSTNEHSTGQVPDQPGNTAPAEMPTARFTTDAPMVQSSQAAENVVGEPRMEHPVPSGPPTEARRSFE